MTEYERIARDYAEMQLDPLYAGSSPKTAIEAGMQHQHYAAVEAIYIAGFLAAREMAVKLTQTCPAWIVVRDMPRLGENDDEV